MSSIDELLESRIGTNMTAPIHLLAATSLRRHPLFSALGAAVSSLRRIARMIDAWLEGRQRAAADRDTIARMNDRALRDIGLERHGETFVAARERMRDHLY